MFLFFRASARCPCLTPPTNPFLRKDIPNCFCWYVCKRMALLMCVLFFSLSLLMSFSCPLTFSLVLSVLSCLSFCCALDHLSVGPADESSHYKSKGRKPSAERWLLTDWRQTQWTFLHMQLYACVCINACICMYACICVFKRVHACICICMHACMLMQVCIYARMYACICVPNCLGYPPLIQLPLSQCISWDAPGSLLPP